MNNKKFLGPHLKKHRRMASYTTIKLVPMVRIKNYSHDLKHMVMTTDFYFKSIIDVFIGIILNLRTSR